MADIETLNYIVKSLESNITELKNKLDSVLVEINNSDRHTDAVMRDLDKRLDKFSNELNEKIHREISKINIKYIEMEGRMSAIENTFEKLEKHIDESRKEASVNRRWFIGLIISVVLAISGLVISIFVS
jgi:chromosome segregation ATPase